MAFAAMAGVHARPSLSLDAVDPCILLSRSHRDYRCTCSAVGNYTKPHRRALLVGIAGVAVSLSLPGISKAQEVSQVASTSTQLPKDYVQFVRKLLRALTDAVEVDLSPANEAEVRRKADPAKGLVKEWVSNWRDAGAVAGDPSYKQITESLQSLGEFYLKKGQRARLPKDLGNSILKRLEAASAALPEEANA